MKRKKLIGMLLFIAFVLLIISGIYLYKTTKGYKYNPYTVQVNDERDYEIVLEIESAAQEESVTDETVSEESTQEEVVTEDSNPQAAFRCKSYEELERVFYETFRYQMLWALNEGRDAESGEYVISQEEYNRLISQEETIISWAKAKSESLVGDGKTETEAEEILYGYITEFGNDMSEEEREILSKCGSLAHLFRALIEQVQYTNEGISDFTSGTETNDCQIALSKQAVWLIVRRLDGSSYHYDPAFGSDDPDGWKYLKKEEITGKDGYHAEFVILH